MTKILLLDIARDPDFKISNDGKVYGIRGKELKAKLHQGYLKVRLRTGWVNLHRLLAETFIPNPNNLGTVNHIDGNKLNNSLHNLEWMTIADNVYHAMDSNNHNMVRKPVKDSYGNLYKSQAEASRLLNCVQGNISRAIKTKGFYYNRKWEYA